MCFLAAIGLAGNAEARGADGTFDKRTSSHFILYQDVAIDEASGLRGSRRFEQLVLSELETAYDRLRAQLGLVPPRPLDVVIYDPEVFDRQFAGLFRFPAAGFYGGVICVRGDTVLGRMVRSARGGQTPAHGARAGGAEPLPATERAVLARAALDAELQRLRARRRGARVSAILRHARIPLARHCSRPRRK